jgi:glycosyltransferase involved in cell wall biosynthesis
MSGVSLVVTLKDERSSIEPFVESVLAQSRPPEEILLVDGGSTDGTLEWVAEVARREPRVRLVRSPGSNISQGRNAGIGRAAQPLIAVTDAGTVLASDWLERVVRPLEADAALDVAGGFYEAGGRGLFERCLSTVITPQLAEIDPGRFLPSSRSIAFRKASWERAGGYPEWLNHCEDLVFDFALKRAGARFVFVPEAMVTWSARPSLRAFFRQYFAYARGDGHAGLWPKRHLIRYSAYACGAALLLAGVQRRRAFVVLAGGMGAYFSKFARRIARRPPGGAPATVAAAALVPLIVATGDVAKMIGYPLGLYERHRGRLRLEERS